MNNRIVLGVTGSIAAYKAAETVRLFVKSGCDVKVVMTESARRFIGELTLATLSRHPVHSEMFAPSRDWTPSHIALSDWADIIVIAPCTADVLARMATGSADDLLTATVLACRAPVLAAPAMNGRMWSHPATAANVETLRSRGVHILDTDSGDLACGEQGVGRMADPETIVGAALKLVGAGQ